MTHLDQTMDMETLYTNLDAIFHDPFDLSKNGLYARDFTNTHFAFASVFDTYPCQEEITQKIQEFDEAGRFKKLLMCSGDIGSGNVPIGLRGFSRLIKRLGFGFSERVICDPVSMHTGTDCSLSLEHAKAYVKPNEKGQYPVLLFVRSFHGIRSVLSVIKQTPEMDPHIVMCPFSGATPQNWRGNVVYMSWMYSELHRLTAETALDFMEPHPTVAHEDLVKTRDALKRHLCEDLKIDPSDYARSAPAKGGEISRAKDEVGPELTEFVQDPRNVKMLALAIMESPTSRAKPGSKWAAITTFSEKFVRPLLSRHPAP